MRSVVKPVNHSEEAMGAALRLAFRVQENPPEIKRLLEMIDKKCSEKAI